MSMICNNVQLIGRLGQDPEMKTVGEKAHKRVTFNIAVQDPRRDANGEWIEKTYWHHVVAWSTMAESMSKRLQKGGLVKVMGKLASYEYEVDGSKRTRTYVDAQAFIDLSPNNQPANNQSEKVKTKNGSR